MGSTRMVVGSMVRGCDFSWGIQTMESKVFRSPRLGLDRLSVAAPIPGGLHCTVVLWLDPKHHGGLGHILGAERHA